MIGLKLWEKHLNLEAKEKFFKLLDFTVREGQRDVANSGSYMYPSPLWDKEETD